MSGLETEFSGVKRIPDSVTMPGRLFLEPISKKMIKISTVTYSTSKMLRKDTKREEIDRLLRKSQ